MLWAFETNWRQNFEKLSEPLGEEYNAEMSKKYMLVRHNPVTGHRYVHSDGRNDRIFRDADAARMEAERLLGWGSAHGVEIHHSFSSARQAREYCRLRGEGLDKLAAIQQAKQSLP